MDQEQQQNLANDGDATLEERPPLTQDEQELFDRNPLNRCIYGDDLSDYHDENYLLLGFANTNGLRKEHWKEKNKEIIKFLTHYKFDIIGLAEINLHWPLLNVILHMHYPMFY